MRFFQAAVLIFGLSSAACAMLDQAGHEQTDIEARVVEANELEALYEADLESRDPAFALLIANAAAMIATLLASASNLGSRDCYSSMIYKAVRA
ncbi:uncharacterized protein GLRG_11921 [Colletotrichum graminicola M1.001]|uniref:Uncharacterized protein n=1 Tax=Colletotrichum graminicola (strain M1.001 / M2 / FGSC 10212) TaxID=645133 RepID=E3R0Y7_COLGM|nr:uncharacterized protein GLRG_11921 [Colletotrichum graminicola M1.001]EFQ36775.1 hypothetical protein GLRG_11921 [Colletotrichum graminicola M1.001]